jgi:hypothetical protein
MWYAYKLSLQKFDFFIIWSWVKIIRWCWEWYFVVLFYLHLGIDIDKIKEEKLREERAKREQEFQKQPEILGEIVVGHTHIQSYNQINTLSFCSNLFLRRPMLMNIFKEKKNLIGMIVWQVGGGPDGRRAGMVVDPKTGEQRYVSYQPKLHSPKEPSKK